MRLPSVCPPRDMQFASFFSLGKLSCSCFALTESILTIHLAAQFGDHGVFHTLWPRITSGRAALCDNNQKHSPTSGAASARSTELECHCSRVITRAKCTTTSWNCSICKREQSINGFTDAFPTSWRNLLPKVFKKCKQRNILFPWLLICFILQSHSVNPR